MGSLLLIDGEPFNHTELTKQLDWALKTAFVYKITYTCTGRACGLSCRFSNIFTLKWGRLHDLELSLILFHDVKVNKTGSKL